VIDRVVAGGGTVRTRPGHRFAESSGRDPTTTFCSGPDGNRIELIQHQDTIETAAHGRYLGPSGLGWLPGAQPKQSSARV
jgi:hypothetical protein